MHPKSPTGNLVKTERNVKFISNIAEVHPKSPTGNLVKTERNVKFISNIAEKGADGIRLRLRYHIHGNYFLSAKKSFVLSASTRSSVKT